jgi:hypothetical protein
MPTWNFKAAAAIFLAPVSLGNIKTCPCCGKTHTETTAFAAISGELIMWDCECGSTIGAKL